MIDAPDGNWPALPLEEWEGTRAALHLWMQIVGKIRLVTSPWLSHSWHATFYVTARGLTTALIHLPARSFQISFDLIDHRVMIHASDGRSGSVPLVPQSVAAFYRRLMSELRAMGIVVRIFRRPCEIPDATPFDQDTAERAYDADAAHRFWRILVQVDRVFSRFRARYLGKSSPVHLFWGAQDLAVTRFSGREAPLHPGGIPGLPDWVTRDAYSHEVSSCGFWPGGGPVPYPAFYAYAYPEPPGYSTARIEPSAAYYSQAFHEFILPYDTVRNSASPDETLTAFLQTTYDAAANLGRWNRPALERSGELPLKDTSTQ